MPMFNRLMALVADPAAAAVPDWPAAVVPVVDVPPILPVDPVPAVIPVPPLAHIPDCARALSVERNQAAPQTAVVIANLRGRDWKETNRTRTDMGRTSCRSGRVGPSMKLERQEGETNFVVVSQQTALRSFRIPLTTRPRPLSIKDMMMFRSHFATRWSTDARRSAVNGAVLSVDCWHLCIAQRCAAAARSNLWRLGRQTAGQCTDRISRIEMSPCEMTAITRSLRSRRGRRR